VSQASRYQQFEPSSKLSEVIDSFWVHHNPTDQTEHIIISPDSYFKILIYVQKGKIVRYFKTGIWTEPKDIYIPPHTYTLGCRFNILAPEYLFRTEIAELLNTTKQLGYDFLDIRSLTFEDFTLTVGQWENKLLSLRGTKSIEPHKRRLAQIIYNAKGSLSAKELADQIYLTNRTINRYLNRYLGISLKTYIGIQRAFQAYQKIRNGEFSPTSDFYDQSHYIREIKKHTGESPRKIFKGMNDRFIQFRHMI